MKELDNNMDIVGMSISSTEIRSGENHTISTFINHNHEYAYGGHPITIMYISDIHLEHHIDVTKKEDEVKRIVAGLFDDFGEPPYDISNLFFLGDIANTIELSELFYRTFANYYKKHISSSGCIYVIPGNHEMTEFDYVMDCWKAYNDMLWKISIRVTDPITGRRTTIHPFRLLNGPVDNLWYFAFGIPGFAQYNEQKNASNLCGSKTFSREKEIKASRQMEDYYKDVLANVQANDRANRLLVVCSHYPVDDWIAPQNRSERCVYFCGHNHENKIIDENGYTIYMDGQVGYGDRPIRIKKVRLGSVFNPYVNYEDGIHTVNIEDYRHFCAYSGKYIEGTKKITKRISQFGDTFYMLKKKGYYCFLLIGAQGAKICYGGNYLNIGKNNIVKDYYNDFVEVIEDMIKRYFPYRRVQESISEIVKEFGGCGRIHGCIIDLSFTNHIMLNPDDGKITFYYSPNFGEVQEYDTFESLLKHSCDGRLDERKKDLLVSLEDKLNPLIMTHNEITTSELVHVDIKNSVYATSRDMCKIQFLYESHILGFWRNEMVADLRKYIDKLETNNTGN